MVIGSTTDRIKARRVALSAVVLIVALGGSYLLLRSTSLRGLPDVGDPFDVAQYATVSIPEDENAFTFFRRATDRFVGHESDIGGSVGQYTEWSQIPPDTLRALEQNRESLGIWFEGTKRSRAVYLQPGDSTIETLLPVVQRLRSFSRLATFRARRLELDGDYGEAWDWHRAHLRCGLLTGQNGFVIERLVGIAIYASASAQAIHWADEARVDATLLRRALDDTLAMEAIGPAYSSTVRYEYYTVVNSLAEPRLLATALSDLTPAPRRTSLTPWKDRLMKLYAIALREPERSRRVARLILANWLSACDLPTAERASRAVEFGQLTLYRPAPDELSPLPPEELARWYESTIYAKVFFPIWKNIEAARTRGERTRAALIVHLAEQLYRCERGKEPSSPQELVGPYLKALPVGYVLPSDDPKTQVPAR